METNLKKEIKRPETFKEWKKLIKKQIPYINVKPFSHSIINAALSTVTKKYGKTRANKIIEDLGLEKFGWKQKK